MSDQNTNTAKNEPQNEHLYAQRRCLAATHCATKVSWDLLVEFNSYWMKHLKWYASKVRRSAQDRLRKFSAKGKWIQNRCLLKYP